MTTLRAWAKRTFEDALVEAVACLDCGRPRGRRCVGRNGHERIRCCAARFDYGRPILAADHDCRALLREYGGRP